MDDNKPLSVEDIEERIAAGDDTQELAARVSSECCEAMGGPDSPLWKMHREIHSPDFFKNLELPVRVEKFWAGRWSDRVQKFIMLWPGSWDVEALGSILGWTGNWTVLLLREVQEGEPEGSYWAWEDFQKGNEWRMPQPSQLQLNMCFPHGPQVEVDGGRGRVVNLMEVE